MMKFANKIFVFFGLAVVAGGSLGLSQLEWSWPAAWTELSYSSNLAAAAPATPPRPVVTHMATPESVRALYMTSWVAGTPDLRTRVVELVKQTEANALVIDVKDYTGRVSFLSDDELINQVGSAEDRIPDIADWLQELHQANIYLIARIAVFQDPHLVEVWPEWAVKSAATGQVWQDYKGAKWMDPASRPVWDYAAAIARTAYTVGFDEINFDYIRFPSDGQIADLAYPVFDEGVETKPAALRRFFAYLESELSDIPAPLSVDFFGMTTTNTDDLNIGQVLEDAAAYFDYIAPMVYPSHYPPGFLNYKKPAEFPYEIIKHSLDEAVRRLETASSTPAKLRPWLQDFDLGAVYTADMVRLEKQAVYDAGLASWMMWDPSNHYTAAALDAYGGN